MQTCLLVRCCVCNSSLELKVLHVYARVHGYRIVRFVTSFLASSFSPLLMQRRVLWMAPRLVLKRDLYYRQKALRAQPVLQREPQVLDGVDSASFASKRSSKLRID